jgi:hypothetical protein
MHKTRLIILLLICYSYYGLCQDVLSQEKRISFNGIIRDASSLEPIVNSQIRINGIFTAVSDMDGTFTIRVNKKDTVEFSTLGYQPAYFFVSDTLSGNVFLAGVYMKSDTLSIGEVVIIPRMAYLKSEILKPPPVNPEMENAKYNIAVSGYQGRTAISKLGDPASNYSVLHEQQRIEAYEKGTIPSDRMVGLNPLILIPAAYLLLNGFPEKGPPMKANLSKQELEQIHKKYLESMRNQ